MHHILKLHFACNVSDVTRADLNYGQVSVMRTKICMAAATALMATVALSGCGSSSDGDGTSANGTPRLKVMAFPSADPTIIPKVGIEQGFFEEEGLDVEYVEQPGNLDSYQALEATESQITMTSVADMAAAAGAGQDSLQFFCGNQPQNFQSLVAKEDADIPSVEEGATGEEILEALEGKTVGSAVPAGSGYQKLLEAAVEEAGVKDVTYITVGTDPAVGPRLIASRWTWQSPSARRARSSSSRATSST